MKILLAVDASEFSEAAIQAVLAQFSPKAAEVQVFHAVDWEEHLPPPYLFAQSREAARDALALRERMVREADEYVKRIAKRLQSAGFAAGSETSSEGDPGSAILDAAKAFRADLIVVGSHGRSGLGRFLLGSVSDRVVRHAPCSVQVVRPAARTRARRK